MAIRCKLTISKRSPKALCLAILIALYGWSPLALPAASEQALTVAFLYNFIKLSEWPESDKSGELAVCVSRQADIKHEVMSLSGKEVDGNKIVVVPLEQDTDTGNCHLLYLSQTDSPEDVNRWIKSASNTATLLVGNYNALLDSGGMIAIFNDGERLQFDVDLEPVKRAKIKLSSEMLKIAHTVKGN